MASTIRDLRETEGTPIKSMPDGTWFVTNLGLCLRASQDVCVDCQTGRRAPFNEDHEGQPVDVEIRVIRNSVFGGETGRC